MAFAFALSLAPAAYATPPIELVVEVAQPPPQIRGSITIDFRNTSNTPLSEIVWLLFPNRFAEPDTGVNDFNRPFVYPYQDFSPGGLKILETRVGQTTLTPRFFSAPDVPEGCLLSIDLPTPLAPQASLLLRLQFETTIPDRFGSFGVFEDMLTAVGGWYPYVANLHGDGTWGIHEPPPVSTFHVDLHWHPPQQVVLNGKAMNEHSESPGYAHHQFEDVHFLTLVAADEFERDEIHSGPTTIEHWQRPKRRADRRAFGPSQKQIDHDILKSIFDHRPPGVPTPPNSLVVVEAPLRMSLTAPSEGMVVISDRSFKVNSLLRPFHEGQIAQEIYAELLRPVLATREPVADVAWLREGLASAFAREYLEHSAPPTRSVQSWIELFNIFAIVDRFEHEPKIPFVQAFFDRTTTADALHEQIDTFNRDIPPGRVIMAKLRQLVGNDAFDTVLRSCATSTVAFRECAAKATGQPLDEFFRQWLQPYPQIDYQVESVDLNESTATGEFRHEVVVRRSSSRPIVEPVDIELRGIGGHAMRVHWDGRGDSTTLSAAGNQRTWQAVVDPDQMLIETTRADNASPPTPQLVIDSSEIEISSTEFGYSALVVGRGRYDYHKDVAIDAFYTNRSIGFTVGPRLHWGEPNDSTLYRHNLYAFYSVEAFDRSFTDNRTPDWTTSGHGNGLGLRYNYNNIFNYDNPTREIDFGLHADWRDQSLGSDYNYAAWGANLVVTHPLGSPRTILAGQLVGGFSEPLGSSRVPNQGLYSLGGSRSIRGIGAEEELGRNIFIVRSELRQSLYPELDLNLLDFLVLRRFQGRLFVDTGNVDNSAGAAFNPQRFAVGVGVGVAVIYDFLGFFPSQAYVEVATRADRSDDVQFLFGTRQPF